MDFEKKMKKGFTLIELIFVIVLLGIMAAVAIPKLSATRDDAKNSKAAMDIAVALNDIMTYYVAKGSFPMQSNGIANLKKVTNIPLEGRGWYTGKGFEQCIQFRYLEATGDDVTKSAGRVRIGEKILRVSGGDRSSQEPCKSLQKISSDILENSPYSLSGERIIF